MAIIKWEELDSTTGRLRISEGWVIRTQGYDTGVAICFVPDPAHNWVINE